MNIKIQITEFQLPPFFLFFFLKELYIFIARYTMKLLLEFANKVRSLSSPLPLGLAKKKKKKRETIVTMETTIQFRFSFLPRVSMGV